MLNKSVGVLGKKYRGCLLGGLLGDCLGLPFRGDKMTKGNQLVLQNYMDQLWGKYTDLPKKNYSEISSMTRCLAESLLDQNGFVSKDYAKRLVADYTKNHDSGTYGNTLPHLCHQWAKTQFRDVHLPADCLYNGQGSYGNNGTTRISPIVLFYLNHKAEMIDAVKTSTTLTHAHQHSQSGSILLSLALCICLRNDPNEHECIKPSQILDQLIDEMGNLEKYDFQFNFSPSETYCKKMENIKELLEEGDNVYDEKIIFQLGNGNEAFRSVPTALYCFLRAQNSIPNIKTTNPLRRGIQYAISLGGDTSGIASMVGSLSGAYYGESLCSKSIKRHCEDSDGFVQLAYALLNTSLGENVENPSALPKI